MISPTVLFLNTTPKTRPEISETEALWALVAELTQQKGWVTQSVRLVEHEPDMTPIFAQIQQAAIVILGLPLTQGRTSTVYTTFLNQLQSYCQTHFDVATGRSPLYNTVFGAVVVGDAHSGTATIAGVSYDFGQLGCVNPPQNTVAWFQPLDTTAGFIEAKGENTVAVNREARLLVENAIAVAQALQHNPLQTNVREINQTAKAIAKAAQIETGALMIPKVIQSPDQLTPEGIDCRHTTKRIWTMMQAGIARGFTIKAISLGDRMFRAEREGKGFIYKIYPGHFSFRRQYDDYAAEQWKSRKLERLAQAGLPVPIAYGVFDSFADIPIATLQFPLVAKPDSGSLSRDVFTDLRTVAQLQQAAIAIEASGERIKLESHIAGLDYRVLIVNHQYAGCVERRRANVVGDGEHNILELIQRRNQEPGRGDRYEAHTTLHQLVFDDTSRDLLDQAGYTLETVLPAGELFYIQTKIPASLGADYVDCTDALHPSIVEGCVDFSHQFSTLTLGFDLITPDISRPLGETGGAFNEYNFLPYVDLHEHCNIGQKRSVCHLVWDYIEANAERIVTEQFQPF